MTESPKSTDSPSPSDYNVRGGLGAIGTSLFVQTVHEMNDGRDIQQLLASSSYICL